MTNQSIASLSLDAVPRRRQPKSPGLQKTNSWPGLPENKKSVPAIEELNERRDQFA